eukprot:COSAG06_NODE_69218_length_198_cov_29.848485_1_plen_40_part_10
MIVFIYKWRKNAVFFSQGAATSWRPDASKHLILSGRAGAE